MNAETCKYELGKAVAIQEKNNEIILKEFDFFHQAKKYFNKIAKNLNKLEEQSEDIEEEIIEEPTVKLVIADTSAGILIRDVYESEFYISEKLFEKLRRSI